MQTTGKLGSRRRVWIGGVTAVIVCGCADATTTTPTPIATSTASAPTHKSGLPEHGRIAFTLEFGPTGDGDGNIRCGYWPPIGWEPSPPCKPNPTRRFFRFPASREKSRESTVFSCRRAQGGRKVIDAQGLFDRIPCSREQGILMAEQGKYIGDTEKPAAAFPILDRAKGQANTGTAAELSAREGAPDHFLGNDCRYPATTIDGPSAGPFCQ